MEIVVGTSGWQYKEWRGSFYPPKMKEADMLAFYAQHLTAVEVNYTFRGVLKPSIVERWKSQVPASFHFILKAPQQITHFKRLRDAAPDVERLLTAATPLGDQLGPILVQLPPSMKVDEARLEEFLTALPAGTHAALEFRHESWHTDVVFDALRRHNQALCLAEAEDLTTPRVATADWGYLRLRHEEYDNAALHEWRNWVAAQEWKTASVFFRHENEARGPRFAIGFQELVAQS
ncbi:MAG: hypothetical protein QOF51_4043 [Chloroflexota bacterium]|nr:hypothetical protein [Chloroflexota bacterium]